MQPVAVYRQRLSRFESEAQSHESRSRRLSGARLLTMLVALLLLGWIVARAADPPAWAIGGALLALTVFAVLVTVHSRVVSRLTRARELAAIQRAALARIERNWQTAPRPAAPPIAPAAGQPTSAEGAERELIIAQARTDLDEDPRQALARDLDLFGHASLFQLLGTAWTPPGRTALAAWLLEPASPEEIADRQQAVRDLTPRLDLRQAVEREARRLGETDPDPSRFLAWAEGEPWLLRRPALVWTSRLLPLAGLATAAIAALGALPWGLAALPWLVNLALSWYLRDQLETGFAAVDAGASDAQAYARSLELVGAPGYDSPRLGRLAAALRPVGVSAWRWMRRLARRLEIADARHGSFHVIPQILTLWDFHSLWSLERWRESVGGEVRGWLEALGEIEALAALAGLAHDQPDWALPVVEPGDAGAQPVLTAQALGHPLLADDVRVSNDVSVGPAGTFLLVTGSNMAGKSTLLRTLGLNAVLAQAGGPVCARSLSLPPLTVATSMRVSDSLASGVSRFMAEALRIRAVVEAARSAPAERPVLYLLDEALAGTNARERQEAMRSVISHLLAAGALGAVAGHDLELAETPALQAASQPFHFRETIHPDGEAGPRMTFDYRLRPGLAETSNALELMKLLGLGETGAGG